MSDSQTVGNAFIIESKEVVEIDGIQAIDRVGGARRKPTDWLILDGLERFSERRSESRSDEEVTGRQGNAAGSAFDGVGKTEHLMKLDVLFVGKEIVALWERHDSMQIRRKKFERRVK